MHDGYEFMPVKSKMLKGGTPSSTEDFSYFTLRREATSTQNATSLFGISCTRQIPASSLIVRSPDVTRSTVQKAVVVVTDGPQYFGPLREKLSMVTSAWFAQRYNITFRLLMGVVHRYCGHIAEWLRVGIFRMLIYSRSVALDNVYMICLNAY